MTHNSIPADNYSINPIHTHTYRKTNANRRGFPKIVYLLFFLFSLYLVLPIIDVPLMGLSISAPIFFFITIFCLLKPPFPWFKAYRNWIILAVLIWAGIFIAAAFNGLLSGGVDINSDGVKTVIRYAYWLLVFVITVFFASQGNFLPKVTELLGWGAMVLALLRWGEVLVYGNIGAWTGTHLLSQNAYGIQFSTFSPFLLILMLRYQGKKRVIAAVGNVLLWSAVAINGSRSSWVTIGIGFVLFLFFLVQAHSKKVIRFVFFLALIIGIAAALISTVPKFSEAFVSRFNTFENLDTDKSYAIRQLMNQKSLKLFANSPIIGVGAARFRLESVPLEIPAVLSYASQEHFDVKSSHNSYLSFLAENGLAGSVPFVILLGILGIKGFVQTRNFVKMNQYWALAIFLGFVQMSIHMWTLASLTNTSNWFIYGLVGAMIMVGKNQLKRNKAS